MQNIFLENVFPINKHLQVEWNILLTNPNVAENNVWEREVKGELTEKRRKVSPWHYMVF